MMDDQQTRLMISPARCLHCGSVHGPTWRVCPATGAPLVHADHAMRAGATTGARHGGRAGSIIVAGAVALLVVGALAGFFATGLGSSASSEAPSGATVVVATPAAPAVTRLPPPFSALYIGMPVEEMLRSFPAHGDVGACRTQLVGGEMPRQRVPGEDATALHTRCPGMLAVAGVSHDEEVLLAETAVDLDEKNADDAFRGYVVATAQIRVALRAGVLSEADVIAAAPDTVDSARAAAVSVAAQLYGGSLIFLVAGSARPPVAATLVPGCRDIDRDRVRAYVAGEYTLGQIDTEALARIAPCLEAFRDTEVALNARFTSRVGGLAGIGLSRASRPDRKLDPNDPSTFAVFETRSRLARPAAKLGVRVANALPELERWLDGAVEVYAGDEGPFRSALVWIAEGKVVRAVVTLGSVEGAAQSLAALEQALGPGRTAGAVTTWTFEDGTRARLDRGAAWVFFMERAPRSAVKARPVADNTPVEAPRTPAPEPELVPARGQAGGVVVATPEPKVDAAAPPTARRVDSNLDAPNSGTGTVRVAARGGFCVVSVNGAAHGSTPAQAVVASGSVRVTCTPEGGAAMSQVVHVDPGGTTRVDFVIPARGAGGSNPASPGARPPTTERSVDDANPYQGAPPSSSKPPPAGAPKVGDFGY